MRPVPAGLGVNRPRDAHRLLGEPAEELTAVLHLAHALREHLAHLQGHQGGEVFGAIGDLLEHRAQNLAAFAGRGGGPFGLHGAGGVQRGDGVLGGGVRDRDQNLVVGRVEHVERRLTLAFLTTDPQPGGN